MIGMFDTGFRVREARAYKETGQTRPRPFVEDTTVTPEVRTNEVRDSIPRGNVIIRAGTIALARGVKQNYIIERESI